MGRAVSGEFPGQISHGGNLLEFLHKILLFILLFLCRLILHMQMFQGIVLEAFSVRGRDSTERILHGVVFPGTNSK